jgi:hypothetical protein
MYGEWWVMQHRAASRRSLAFGILFALVAMALSLLAVLAATTVHAPAAQAQYAQTSTNQSTTAQTTTAENTTTASANTSNKPANGLRCADILRITRSAGQNQYNISAQRIRQCLRNGVLAGTIPNKLLPGTGGPPAAVLGLAALAFVSVVAGASVFRAGTRRRR